MNVNPAPTNIEELLDPTWLSAALSTPDTQVKVASVALAERIKTVASKLRIKVAYDGDAKLPTSLCIKVNIDQTKASSKINSVNETRFYRDLGSSVGLRIPNCYYAGINGETGEGVLILEDLIDSGCRFRTARIPYTVDEVAGTLAELAQMHAAYWDDKEVLQQPWLRARIRGLIDIVGDEQLGQQLNDGRFDRLDPQYRDPHRLKCALGALDARRTQGPVTLTHGDTHAGNLYVTASGGHGFLDWQIVQRNCWALDVAYHIAGVLSTDDRTVAERELLDHYLDCLGRNGVTAPNDTDAWSTYRANLVYGHYLWAITRFVDRDITEEMCSRLGAAVQFHRSYELLEA